MMQFFSFLTACDFCSFSSKAAQQHLNDHPKNFSSFGRFLSFRLEKASRRKKSLMSLKKLSHLMQKEGQHGCSAQ